MDAAAPASALLAAKTAIIDRVMTEDYARHPELAARYGERGRAFYQRDCGHHLDFLAEAVAHAAPALFSDYIAWASTMLPAHGVRVADLAENLRLLQWAIREQFPGADGAVMAAPIEAALAQLPQAPATPPSFIAGDQPHDALAQQFLDLLLLRERRAAADLVATAVTRDGLPLQRLYLDVFQRSQREIGRLWQLNRIGVADEHFATAATMALMNRFFPQFAANGAGNGPRAVCCCVEGDLHELGLRMVADFLEMGGWDCDYLGANTPRADLLRSLAADPPDLVALSATMTFHVGAVAELIRQLRAQPETAGLPVLVGGRPFLVEDTLWRKIGADAFAHDADSVIDAATRLTARGAGHA
ncbi:MAG: cobalamin-dependent protein [Xanthomonadales bacterium]|nr:cobalamin-dependent protein [Xanthomonadales bacterium]